MLAKLIKYDFKWVYKVVIVFNILAFIFSGISRGLSCIENSLVFSVLTSICSGIAISMMVSSLINCGLRLWVRFIRNTYKDESYLTHTLPVSNKAIYLSKVLTAIMSLLTTVLVIVVCLFICYGTKANLEFLKASLELAATTYNTTIINFILIVGIIFFLEMLFIVLIGYVGIILGHKANDGRIVRSIVYGFAIYMLSQVITVVAMYIGGIFNSKIMNLINTTDVINIDAIKAVMFVGIGMYLLYNIILYLVGKKEIEKGVNVE